VNLGAFDPRLWPLQAFADCFFVCYTPTPILWRLNRFATMAPLSADRLTTSAAQDWLAKTPARQQPHFIHKTHSNEEVKRAKREATNNDCPFLKLPPELRNRIYQYVIQTNILYTIHKDPLFRGPWEDSGILQTCRVLRAETLPIRYGGNNSKLGATSNKTCAKSLRWIGSLLTWLSSPSATLTSA
jgi:hypothetical protein